MAGQPVAPRSLDAVLHPGAKRNSSDHCDVTAQDKMVNFGLVSQWHHVNNVVEMDTLRYMLREGDIVQIKHWKYFYCWAVCTRDGPDPQMAHRFGGDYLLMPPNKFYEKGSVHEIGWDELRRDNRFHIHKGSYCHYAIHNRNSNLIRINNSRDKITAPKPVADILRCALDAVGTTGDDQFGPYHAQCNNDIDFVERVRYPRAALDSRLDESGCSRWHTATELESFSWLMRPGDMVEFNRKNVYSHWAVAVERLLDSEACEPLVHRSGSGDSAEVVNKLIGTIMKSTIQEVIKGSRFRVNNSRDRMYLPRDTADIRQFAIDSVYSKAFGKYNLAINNCWHFAMQARYRVKVPKNTELVTAWYGSTADILPLLSAGDIIEFGERFAECKDRYQELAIYVERVKTAGLFSSHVPTVKSSEVVKDAGLISSHIPMEHAPEVVKAAGLFSSHVPTVKTPEVAYLSRSHEPQGLVVRLISAEEFFTNVARDKDFRINNQRDYMWKPKDFQDIVRYVVDADGKEDPYFVVGARYGKKVREEVRGVGGHVSEALAGIKIPWYMGLGI